VYNIHAYVLPCNERNTPVCCKFTQLHSHQILLKSVNIWLSYCEKQKGELFLKHSVVFSLPNGTAIFRRLPPPLTRAPNSGVVGRSLDSEPISEFTACCWRCYQPGVVNTTSSDHRPASCDTSLVVSGGVCWWRKKTAKFLWQEVSALRQRQQNSI